MAKEKKVREKQEDTHPSVFTETSDTDLDGVKARAYTRYEESGRGWLCSATLSLHDPGKYRGVWKSKSFSECNTAGPAPDKPNKDFGLYLAGVRAVLDAGMRAGLSRRAASRLAREFPHLARHHRRAFGNGWRPTPKPTGAGKGN